MTGNVIADPHMSLGGNMKFQILTARLQNMPIHILDYQLSSSENVDIVQVTNFAEGNIVFFLPLLTAGVRIKILKKKHLTHYVYMKYIIRDQRTKCT